MRASCVLGLSILLVACPGASDDAGSAPRAGGASGPPAWIGVAGERLAPLPMQASATSPRFATSDVCAQCHLAGDGDAVRDAKGRDVSPVGRWRASAMALAARDPYWLAVYAEELRFRPNLAPTVDDTCTRCHAPEASVELAIDGTTPTFASITGADASPAAHLGREGVACTLCHQIAADGLGEFASFTGGFVVGDQRRIYGPYTDPTTDPMRTLVSYEPTFGAHVGEASLCGTCHTVVTRPRDAKGNVGPEFPEQTPYLEWLASAFSTEGTPGPKAASCQDCHMAAADDDGAELSVVIARTPPGLRPRKPFWRHGFAGANAQLSRFGASDPTWFGVKLTKDDHEGQARADEAMVRRAATVAIDDVKRTGDGVEIAVRVENQSGHKLPTGYPSRRVFLHVKVEDGARTVFESGRTDDYGRLVAGDRVVEPTTFAPHVDVVDREDTIQIYESVPVDVNGKIAHRPFDDHHYVKDNRLLPAGFDRRNRWSAYTAPHGVDGDADWGASDVVRFRVARAPSGAKITVSLEFQAIRPADLEALAARPTPAARRLFDMATAAPLRPVVLATAERAAP